MSLIGRFDEFFRTLWGYEPFPWQTRLAKLVINKGWPECIDLPTASGKTACIDIAVFVLACQADRTTNERTVGRRIFFTVNRRVIVDEAFDRSFIIAEQLLKAQDGILKEVADALHEISGDQDAPPLDVAQLRGGIYCDRAWARSITQPIVICTTADQLGSRLLFRGYGVSSSMQPVHAALTACDSLILLDEAHVTRAFCQTMQLVERYRKQDTTSPPMRFIQMTATPTGLRQDAKSFELENDDRVHPILNARQIASKPATLIKLEKKKPIAGEIVSRAFDALSEPRKAIGIVVNRVQTARDINRVIQEAIDRRTKKDPTFKAEVHLLIGRMRPIDRDELQEKLRMLVGPDRPDILDNAVFVVATQCLEVGADYDFDALFTECASIDALRQRFGRLNRKGRPIEVVAAIVTNEESLKGDDPIYGDAIKHTWDWLTKKDRESIDFGIVPLGNLWDGLDEALRQKMFAPAPDAAVLLPAHLDALCQTAPQPEPSPDLSFFIHGPQRDMAEVNVCWRADLGNEPAHWPEIVRLLPPTSPECMTVPIRDLRNWMIDSTTRRDRDADVPVLSDSDQHGLDRNSGQIVRRVVVWRGSKECRVVETPSELHPGDTIVIQAQDYGWAQFGHIPDAPIEAELERGELESDESHAKRKRAAFATVDVAERATRQSRLRLAVRLHDVFPGRSDLRGLRADELRPQLRIMLEKEIANDDERRRVLTALNSRIDRHQYEEVDEDTSDVKHNEVTVFKDLLEPPNRLALPTTDEDDGENSSIESTRPVTLSEHTQHVVDRVGQVSERLHLNGHALILKECAHLHDIGKADIRFQALLAGLTPWEAMDRPTLLAKSGQRGLTRVERDRQRITAQLPDGFRHEMLSVQLIIGEALSIDLTINRDLLLHLIAAHHGHARPFAPVVIDDATDEVLSVEVDGISVTPEQRRGWIPSHRLDSGVAERFWKLTREYGWWGLAWLESILRLADQQASAAEQDQSLSKKEQRDE